MVVDGEVGQKKHDDIGRPIGQPSEHADDWKLLRRLLWICWQTLDGQDGRASLLLIERWRMLAHPTFGC
jgi:hypothetical protein